MYITKEKFDEICKKYPTLILSEGDAVDALNFVEDLLLAEAEAIEAVEPDATTCIERLKKASYEVFDLGQSVDNDDFRQE